ncbi:uncharacterized protein IL334_007213 [Kwoniella shivajii]|uniref:Uncharacterized protein n=1 Tax=Kwoniella shivajii TaxID=564305 RepID=A0ABZ1D8J4_9TREE|nr:hypothetical protein IL334_007213 [Kwoniella shivajii]
MSAVVDSISEVVTSSSPAPISTQNVGEGEADVSSIQPITIGSGDKTNLIPSPSTTLGDTSGSTSALTRIITPSYDQSTSGHNRRVSISTAMPLVTTFTPERNNHLYHYEEDGEPQPSDSEPSDIDHSAEPLLSPYQPVNADISIESKATSGSDMISTLSTEPPDLSFGPQSVPFPLRRRGILIDAHSTPSRPSSQSFTPKFRTAATPPVVIRPASTVTEKPAPSVSPIQAVTHTPLVVASFDNVDIERFSSWRREQIKLARTAKLMAGTTPRPIPTLHGPLSLPYARNPSGVDATVPDESAYLSHVFGLRAAPGTTMTDNMVTATRVVSSGTHSSGTTGSRSVSGSSGTGNASQNRSILTDGSSYSSTGGTHYSRPYVMRDPNQNIGIKIKGIPPRESPSLAITKENKPGNIEINQKNKFSSDSNNVNSDENKENVDPSPGIRPRRASETSLLEPNLGDTVLGPSKSFVNLRDMAGLSPIPGSPADNAAADPFGILYNQALTSATGGFLPDQLEISSGAAHPVRNLPTNITFLYNPTTMAYEASTIQPRKSSYDDLHVNTPIGVVTPQILKEVHGTSNHPSKADSSENWRKKGDCASSPVKSRTESDLGTSAPPHQTNYTSSNIDVRDTFMTIDSLFEKFTHTSDQVETAGDKPPSTVPFNPPSMIAESVKLTNSKPSKSIPVSPRKTSVNVLGETTRKLNVNAAPYSPSKSDRGSTSNKHRPSSPVGSKTAATPAPIKMKTSSAKGTPGAGKLLKRASLTSEGEEENSFASPSVPVAISKAKSRGRSGKR